MEESMAKIRTPRFKLSRRLDFQLPLMMTGPPLLILRDFQQLRRSFVRVSIIALILLI